MIQTGHDTAQVSAPAHAKYEDVATAFGLLARDYDATFDPNIVIRRLRDDLYSTIESLVDPPAKILDINCGTGTDALALSARGYPTVGVDVTQAMIAEARRKSAGNPKVRFVHASYDNMEGLPEKEFDLVLSNFGGLNCTNNLSGVAEDVAKRLKPGGLFLAVLMPPFSIWETCAYTARGRFAQAFRRMRRGGTTTGFHGRMFTVHYYSPRAAARHFSSRFLVRKVYAWNVFTPPPHAWRIAAAVPVFTRILEKLDGMICRLPFFRSIGDHYVMILQERSHDR